MKNNLIILTFIFSGFLANAQIDFSDVDFGVKAGVNMSIVSEDFESTPLYSFHAGGYFEAEITDGVIIRPELLYSSEGFNAEFYNPEFDSNVENEFKLDYLSLVMVFKYEIAEGFGIEGGGTLSYLLSGEQTVTSSNVSSSRDIKDDLAKIDVALTGGLYYEFESGLNFSLRYSYGIKSVFKSEDGFTRSDFSRRLVQLSAGYSF